jgi:hypothetical protein
MSLLTLKHLLDLALEVLFNLFYRGTVISLASLKK